MRVFFFKNENIIWMDADYSHPPIYLKKFVSENIIEYDVIVFSRFLSDSERYFESKKIKPKLIDNLSIYLNKICKYFYIKILLTIAVDLFVLKKTFR